MLTKIMKWVSIGVLLLLAGLSFPTASYQVLLGIVVCVSGLLVVTRAVRAGKYIWVAGFSAIVVLFNPVVPIGLSGQTLLRLDWLCLAAFLVCLTALKWQPTLSIASITNRTPGVAEKLASKV
jgi:hypothetical protein